MTATATDTRALDELCVNTIKTLSMDAVQKANSGHPGAPMVLYSMLYLTGYPMTLDDIKNFRQVGAPTAGHPERKYSPGIEVTTGPLGQGLATAVGMALGERMLAARFGDELVGHHTF